MDIAIQTDKEDNFSIVHVSGKIDATTSGKLETTLSGMIDQGEANIILDLENTNYISSAGLRILVVITKKVHGSGNLCICNANKNVYEIIEMAGFHAFMTICDSIEAAKQKITEV